MFLGGKEKKAVQRIFDGLRARQLARRPRRLRRRGASNERFSLRPRGARSAPWPHTGPAAHVLRDLPPSDPVHRRLEPMRAAAAVRKEARLPPGESGLSSRRCRERKSLSERDRGIRAAALSESTGASAGWPAHVERSRPRSGFEDDGRVQGYRPRPVGAAPRARGRAVMVETNREFIYFGRRQRTNGELAEDGDSSGAAMISAAYGHARARRR